MSEPRFRWGIIGPGNIAKAFRDGLRDSRHGVLAAVATRNPGRESLAADYPAVRVVEGYEALLVDPEIDAVYIALPHTGHARWAIEAARAGKHALVEKPLGVTAREADAIFAAHRAASTFVGEAFMYRLHPQVATLVELLVAGAIGEVRMIQSSFGFQMPSFIPEHRLFAAQLAGGGILDAGCYPVSMARLIAGAAVGKPFDDPVHVVGDAQLNAEGTDSWSAAVLTFASGVIAQVACGTMIRLDNVLRIHGSAGRIELPDFWFAGGNRDNSPGQIDIVRNGERETVRVGASAHLYSYESDAVAEAVTAGRVEFASPGMSWADSLGNARVLDAWRAQAGVVYPFERADSHPLETTAR